MGSLSRLAKIICVSRKPRKAGSGFETDSGVLNPNNIVLPPWKVVLVVPCHRHAELR